MRVTIVKDAHGTECVHRAGCADIKKRGNRAGEAWTADFANLEELYASYWDCIADEAVGNRQYPTLRHAYYAWQGEFNVLPCADELASMDDPDAEPQPEGSKGEDRKMDATAYKAHRTNAMRNPDAMEECLRAHGVTEIPAARTARIKLHDEHCKPEGAEETSQPAPESDEDRKARHDAKAVRDADRAAQEADEKAAAARRRTRKAAPRPITPTEPEPQPDAKPEPPALGVPYAPLAKVGRNMVATCPECGKTFVEKFDKNGEQTTQHYAEHYAETHTAQPESKPEPASKPRTRKAASKPAPKAEEPAKPSGRGRKPQAKPEPAKPTARGRKPAAPQPQPQPQANGTSPRTSKQELARELVNLVAEHFAGRDAGELERVSYWLRSLPVGNPELEGTVGGHLRWWPKSLPRPVGAGWVAPQE